MPGMEIVICASDKYAFQAETWTGECPFCHGSETLSEVPAPEPIHINNRRTIFPSRQTDPDQSGRGFWKNFLIFVIIGILVWWGVGWLAGIAQNRQPTSPMVPAPVQESSPTVTPVPDEVQVEELVEQEPPTQPNPTDPPPAQPLPSSQPRIRNETGCGVTYFRSGMDAFVQIPADVYSIPRFQHADGFTDPEVYGTLQWGEKVFLPEHRDSPKCYHNSLFWYVQSQETGLEGWVMEWYAPHKKDKRSFEEGRYLSVEPP